MINVSTPEMALIHNLIATNPKLYDGAEVVVIERISEKTLVADLNDGTTIRIDIERYTR
jgi:hypothetical protein